MSGSPSALYKAFDILEAFSAHKELSAKDLHARLRIPLATQYRILRALLERGYITRDPQSRRFKLGLKILEIGSAALDNLDIVDMGREILWDLWRETRETIHLSMIDGLEIVYVQTLESPQPIRLVSRTGARAPAYCVASGKAILAFSSDARVEEVIRAGFRQFNDKTVRSAKDFQNQLKDIRAVGFAINRGEWRQEVSGVSAPVFDHRCQVVAAVGISGPTERFIEARLPELGSSASRCAAELSRRLGAVSPNPRLTKGGFGRASSGEERTEVRETPSKWQGEGG